MTLNKPTETERKHIHILTLRFQNVLVISVADQQRIRQAMTETPVAFFATLTSHIVHAGQNQIIAFDRVVTNVGNAYNPHVGAFTAPASGIYVFSVSLLSYPGHTTHYQLM